MYKEIADYGLIGDMHSLALVSKDGSIDYCSMPRMDSPTIFARLLDDKKGGYFSIRPQQGYKVSQSYIEDTNVLSAHFFTNSGEVILFDFMDIDETLLFEKRTPSIYRYIKPIKGYIRFEALFYPRPEYGSFIPRLYKDGPRLFLKFGKDIYTLWIGLSRCDIDYIDGGARIYFTVGEPGYNEEPFFVFSYGEIFATVGDVPVKVRLERTVSFWKRWLSNSVRMPEFYLKDYSSMINRSLLVLKLLTYKPTGAILASATTSLPEHIGGVRNWDYRFTWLRDASFTLKAFFALGHINEAESFIHWLHSIYRRYGSRELQIMYTIDGNDYIPEKTLFHLEGYRGSKPVRIGNDAFRQNQWDIYGEVMDVAFRLSDYAGKIDESLWPFFVDICNLAVKNWNRPDYGIWEVRSGPNHFIYSKVMCWVALDRGIKIARRYGFRFPEEKWLKAKEMIKSDILARGYSERLSSFIQAYNSEKLDASVLLIPIVNFLPFDDLRVQKTIEASLRYLSNNGFLMRYTSEDGLKGTEGAFVLCNFWLVECLASLNRLDEAIKTLEITKTASNHLGLFSEEYDPGTGRLLGNFPQAFSHIGLINAISELSEHKRLNSKSGQKPPSLKFHKLYPFKVVLNQKVSTSVDNADIISSRLAGDLKSRLGMLQGSFFDVHSFRVNYDAMRKSESFNEYLKLAGRLKRFNLFSLNTDEEKKAFWINIYNILIIHGVIEFGIKQSVKEVFNFFGRIGYNIGGIFFSPDDIEHGILRLNRPHPVLHKKQFLFFDRRRLLCPKRLDPRIHFALVCASSSCPPIEFYDAQMIDKQLDTAGRSFLKRGGLILDRHKDILYLSQIFHWYAYDFGRAKRDILNFINRFADEDIKDFIFERMDKIKIKYLPYNWELNKAVE